MAPQYQIIDADAHVVERGSETYRPYLPEAYRQRTGSFFPSPAWDVRMNGTLGKLDPSVRAGNAIFLTAALTLIWFGATRVKHSSDE